jgi:signal recognition particle receptor subunit beta
MAKVSREASEVNARILYWGIEGAGKTTNLQAAYEKLRADHRHEMKEVPTRLDPTLSYESLPITLGDIAGVRTQIELIAVPGRSDAAPTRKQLLDQVDGVVLVVDSRGDQMEANAKSFQELRNSLAAYGRNLSDVPMVVQYNKRDVGDPYALEKLHRELNLGSTPVFEAVATEGTGVLQTLSTISKRVIRALREQEVEVGATPTPAAAAPASSPAPQPAAATRMEEAILAEPDHPEIEEIETASLDAQSTLDAPWPQVSGEIDRSQGVVLGPDITIVSVGDATRVGDRSVRVPLVLGDPEGQTTTLTLTIQLDALVDGDRD